MTKVYQQAFTEVYELLNYLNKEDYEKIPKNVINALEENRDIKYNFFIDESIPFCEQDILEETKAILFNLYRDYLADSETKNRIIQYQREESEELEKIKRNIYPYENIFIKSSCRNNTNEIVSDDKVSMNKHKNSIIDRILKKLTAHIEK